MEAQRGGAGLRRSLAFGSRPLSSFRRAKTRGLLILVLCAAPGCGGGDDKPSREEFARDAEKVCAELKKQSLRLDTKPQDIAGIAKFARDAKATARSAVEKVQALEVPEGADGDKAEAWQDAVTSEAEDALIPALDGLEKAAEANDAQAIVTQVQKVVSLKNTRSDKLAKEIGAEGCAE